MFNRLSDAARRISETFAQPSNSQAHSSQLAPLPPHLFPMTKSRGNMHQHKQPISGDQVSTAADPSPEVPPAQLFRQFAAHFSAAPVRSFNSSYHCSDIFPFQGC